MPSLDFFFDLLELAINERTQLALENIALRQRLAVYKRSVQRPNIDDGDRIFWMTIMRFLREWKEAVVIVKPETVVKWHRKGFKYYWRRKSRGKPGRPPISMALIHLIRRMSQDNPTWGAPRIVDELALLGHEVGETTVAKYMLRHRSPEKGQSWSTFLKNHMDVTAACDFFVVPTLTFKLLYGFVVLSHDRRRILHVNVTSSPTAEWTAQQMVEACRGDDSPQYLIHDGDGIFGEVFFRKLKALGVKPMQTARRSPWQNCYAERVIGSIRRECLNHVIALNEEHLLRTLVEYAEYYNESRTHQSLGGNAPTPRSIQRDGEIVATPVLGGLHHRYSRAA
jgi:transposase InsO family protein